ncbi:MAG: hypothetical protein ACLRMZ_22885 [Blautia marasmi]
MEAAKSQMEEAEKVRLQTQTKLELYKEQYKADKEAYDILSPQMEKRGKIIEKHTKLETLYKLLSGNMSGNRMDLETYVQRYYLEKILYAANRRFANMSAGQFELRMVDEENAGKARIVVWILWYILMLPAKSVKSVPFPEENPLWQPWHWHLEWQIRSGELCSDTS